MEFLDPQEKGAPRFIYTPVQSFSADSVKSLVASLEKQFPKVVFIIRESQPPVVHMLDRQLLEAEGYPLNQTLKLSYSGTPTGLTYDLEKRLPKLRLVRGGLIGDYYDDVVTPVTLMEAQGKIREILTSAVPLKDYSRVLWRAMSKRLDNGE